MSDKSVLVITIRAEWKKGPAWPGNRRFRPPDQAATAEVRAEVPWEPDPAPLTAAVRNLATAAMTHPELMGEATSLSLVFGGPPPDDPASPRQ